MARRSEAGYLTRGCTRQRPALLAGSGHRAAAPLTGSGFVLGLPGPVLSKAARIGFHMRLLKGRVSSRYGAATPNLRTVEALLLQRTGMLSVAPGTLNLQLEERYIVTPDAAIHADEYFTGETIKLQRCRVRGHNMFIMRPDSHECANPGPEDPARVIELVSPLKLREAWGLRDGNVLEVEVEGDADWWNAPEPNEPNARASE